MERSNNGSLNGRASTVVVEKPLLEAEPLTSTQVAVAPPSEAPAVHQEPEVESVQPLMPEPTPKKKNRKPLIFAIAGIGAIVAGNFGYNWWQYTSTHEETDNATVAGHIHQVSSRINGTVSEIEVNDNQLVKQGQLLVKLDPRDFETKALQAQAALEAAKRQANAAQATIPLAAETTQAKTVQAQGDVTAATSAISTAQAAVEEAKTAIPSAQAAVAEAQAGIPAAQAQVSQADATLQKAQTDYNRYANLYQQGAIARQQLDTAKAAYEVARAQKNAAEQGVQQAQARLAQARQGVARAQSQLAQAQEGVASARAKLTASQGGLQQATASGQQTQVNRAQYAAAQSAIAQAEASLKDAQLQLSYTNIVAPSSGRIGRKTIEVGQRVQPGSPLMAIVESDYWVTANFKETQLEEIKPGQEVEIKLDAFPHHIFKGRVDSVSPASGSQFALLPPDNATGNFTKIVQRIPVKIIFDSQSIQGYESRITPGMSAVVSVEHK
ncbi:HlyD family secretion protein [Allocoleopsis sp.]|uniref:HlyD family secretion protein n=1 Tax=Allocoleopsis sp. TaxID=3088169 RepID=UPI002FD4EC04